MMPPNPRRTAWYLRHAPLLRGASPILFERLANLSTVIQVRRGQPLFVPGNAADIVHFVVGGAVACKRVGSDGRALVVDVASAGAVVAPQDILGGDVRDEMAEATTAAIVVVVPRRLVTAALADHAELALRLAELIARRARATSARLGRMAFQSAAGRVVHEILVLADAVGTAGPEGVRLHLPVQRELAELAAVTRETVALTLGRLAAEGQLVRYPHRLALVPDQHALRVWACQPAPQAR